MKMTSSIFNPFPKHVQDPATRNLFAYTVEEFLRCIGTVLVFQPLIHVRLRVLNKLKEPHWVSDRGIYHSQQIVMTGSPTDSGCASM